MSSWVATPARYRCYPTALENLPDCYERDRARYAAHLALALAGAGDADGALIMVIRAAELAAATGSTLATRELRRVPATLGEHGADAQARALTEHVRALADDASPVWSPTSNAPSTPPT